LLPKLDSLLTPIGRTMTDVDIIGLGSNGNKIFAQVTYSYEPNFKKEKLLKYQNQNCDLILFCKTNNSRIENSIIIYSLDEVFEKFINTPTGMKWINNIR
jgi:hypothetical protein